MWSFDDNYLGHSVLRIKTDLMHTYCVIKFPPSHNHAIGTPPGVSHSSIGSDSPNLSADFRIESRKNQKHGSAMAWWRKRFSIGCLPYTRLKNFTVKLIYKNVEKSFKYLVFSWQMPMSDDKSSPIVITIRPWASSVLFELEICFVLSVDTSVQMMIPLMKFS